MKKDLASTLTETAHFKGAPMSFQIDHCNHRDARLTSTRTSVWEVNTAVVCGSLFFAVFVLAGYLAYRLVEREGHRVFDHRQWHQPLDSWSL